MPDGPDDRQDPGVPQPPEARGDVVLAAEERVGVLGVVGQQTAVGADGADLAAGHRRTATGPAAAAAAPARPARGPGPGPARPTSTPGPVHACRGRRPAARPGTARSRAAPSAAPATAPGRPARAPAPARRARARRRVSASTSSSSASMPQPLETARPPPGPAPTPPGPPERRPRHRSSASLHQVRRPRPGHRRQGLPRPLEQPLEPPVVQLVVGQRQAVARRRRTRSPAAPEHACAAARRSPGRPWSTRRAGSSPHSASASASALIGSPGPHDQRREDHAVPRAEPVRLAVDLRAGRARRYPCPDCRPLPGGVNGADTPLIPLRRRADTSRAHYLSRTERENVLNRKKEKHHATDQRPGPRLSRPGCLAILASCSNDRHPPARKRTAPTGAGSTTSTRPDPGYTVVAGAPCSAPGAGPCKRAGDPEAPLAVIDVPEGYQGRERYVWTHDELDLGATLDKSCTGADPRPRTTRVTSTGRPRGWARAVEDLAEALAAPEADHHHPAHPDGARRLPRTVSRRADHARKARTSKLFVRMACSSSRPAQMSSACSRSRRTSGTGSSTWREGASSSPRDSGPRPQRVHHTSHRRGRGNHLRRVGAVIAGNRRALRGCAYSSTNSSRSAGRCIGRPCRASSPSCARRGPRRSAPSCRSSRTSAPSTGWA